MLNTQTIMGQTGPAKERAHYGPGSLIKNAFRDRAKTTQLAFVHAETGALYPVRVHGGNAGWHARQNVENDGPSKAEVRTGGFVYEVTDDGNAYEIGEVLSFSGGFDRGGKLQPYALVATNSRSLRRSTMTNRYVSRLAQLKAEADAGEVAQVTALANHLVFLAQGFPNDFGIDDEGNLIPTSEIGRFIEGEINAELGIMVPDAESDDELPETSEEEAAEQNAYQLD